MPADYRPALHTRLAAVLLTVFASAALAGDGSWTPLALQGGHPTAFAGGPNGEMYLGTDGGGLYRSDDGGLFWTETGRGLVARRIEEIAVAPGASQALLAATETGLFVSTDGGANWTGSLAGLPTVFDHATAAAFAPEPAGTAWATLRFRGVYRSLDGGRSWSRTPLGAPLDDRFRGLAFDASSNVLFTSVDGLVYRSTDSGSTWSPSSLGLPESFTARLFAVDPTRGETVWVGGSDFVTDQSLYLSTDAGLSWTVPSGGSQGPWTRALEVDAVTGTVYAYGREGLDASSDLGGSWARIDQGLGRVGPEAVFARSGTVLAGVSDSETAGPAAGVFRTTDAGASWHLAPSLAAPPTQSIAFDPLGSGRVLAVDHTGRLNTSEDGGATWAPSPDLDDLVRLVVDPADPDTLYAPARGATAGLFRSRDGGESWSALTGLPVEGLENVAVDPHFPGTLYGVGAGQLVRSTDYGASWATVEAPFLASVTVHPEQPGVLFAGGGIGLPVSPPFTAATLHRSADGGASWERVFGDSPGQYVEGLTQAIEFDPNDPNRVVLAVSGHTRFDQGGLFRSSDGGLSWQPTSLIGGDFVDLMAIPDRPGTFYAASLFRGVYVSRDSGETWDPVRTGLGSAVIHGIADDPLDPDTIAAATASGLWTRTDAGVSCVTAEEVLCLADRFRVGVTWATPGGASGPGLPVEVESPTGGRPIAGQFWFFRPGNRELTMKVVDGRAVNGAYWFFWGATTNLAYEIEVTDTATGVTRRYSNPQGRIASGADTGAFRERSSQPEAPLSRAAEVRSLDERIFLGAGDRFEIVAASRVDDEVRDARGLRLSTDSGYFTFFRDDNLELVVKVIDGRAVNGHFWVFISALSDVEWMLAIRDTETGTTAVYRNPAGELTSLADTSRFSDP